MFTQTHLYTQNNSNKYIHLSYIDNEKLPNKTMCVSFSVISFISYNHSDK